ncbi:hypothetical protein QTP88_002834 [Uroleucon formosanum]
MGRNVASVRRPAVVRFGGADCRDTTAQAPIVVSMIAVAVGLFHIFLPTQLLSYLLLEEIEEEEFLIEQLLVEQSNANEYPLFTSRPEEGFFEILVNRHLIHDDKKFREFFRLNIDQFNYIILDRLIFVEFTTQIIQTIEFSYHFHKFFILNDSEEYF